MGNCCSLKQERSTPGTKRKPTQNQGELEKVTTKDKMKTRTDHFNQMSIFNTASFVERIKSGNLPKQTTIDKKCLGYATKALSRSYRATDKLLGEGTFGQVYMFEKRDNPEKKFAVKIMLKELIGDQHMQSIRDEIVILSIQDHPNVIKYFESYEDERYLFIVMECIEDGFDLEQFCNQQLAKIKNQSPDYDPMTWPHPFFPEEEICRLAPMLIAGVHHIHTNGIVHRDLKP